MYKILFVDEVDADIRRFQLFVHKQDTNKKFEVIAKSPEENLNEFVEKIFSENIDAVISDYQLNEYKSSITYTGVELINRILSIKENYPCFVMTSHDDMAVATSDDVNLVYIKALMNKEDHVRITFLERVEKQIDNYRAKLVRSQIEFDQLIEKSKDSELTAPEEERLEKLDTFLEKAMNQDSKIPAHLKSKSTLEDFHKLIENTDVLLKEIKIKNND